jgi:hypothetical protein
LVSLGNGQDEKGVNFALCSDQCVLHFASYCVAV